MADQYNTDFLSRSNFYPLDDPPLQHTNQAANDRAYMNLLSKATENDLLRAHNTAFMHLYDKNRMLESNLSAQK
jgi:hypothetical protein